MFKNQDISDRCKIPGELDPKTNLPKNSSPVPKDLIPEPGYVLYCCDVRKWQCQFVRYLDNKSYCTYTKD